MAVTDFRPHVSVDDCLLETRVGGWGITDTLCIQAQYLGPSPQSLGWTPAPLMLFMPTSSNSASDVPAV